MTITIPVAKGQRLPISEASDGQLKKFVNWQRKEFDSGKVEPRFVESNQRALDAAEAELERRSIEGPAPEGAQPNTALAKVEMGLAIHDASAVAAQLERLAGSYHLVTPSMHVDAIPEGFGVSTSLVQVDPKADTYEVGGGKHALSGTALQRIAAAAGLSWDPHLSCRLDDGSEPSYCLFRAVGHVKNLDSTVRTVSGQVEIDMRDGSEQVREIREKAEARAQGGRNNDGGAAQIREIRKFILRHAESKAQNRAVAQMGIKRSYEPAELRKPFAVTRLVFTGATSDPELRRDFARMSAQAAFGATSMLYGSPAPQRPALPPPPIEDYVEYEA